MYLQQVALVAALVQTDTALGKLDEVILRLIKLEHLHVAALVNRACVKQELVRRDAEQRLGHFAHLFLIKVLQILRCQQHGGFLFAHTLEAVTDVLNGRGIGQPDIQLVQSRDRVALDQQLVCHIGQQIQQNCAADVGCNLVQSLYTEHKESGRTQIAVTIEELGTIMEQRSPVKIILLNNNYLGNVRQWQHLFFHNRYSFTPMMNPDYEKIAEAYNIPARTVTRREELDYAIQQMLHTDGPFLLQAAVLEEDNVLPMCCPGHDVDDMMLEA